MIQHLRVDFIRAREHFLHSSALLFLSILGKKAEWLETVIAKGQYPITKLEPLSGLTSNRKYMTQRKIFHSKLGIFLRRNNFKNSNALDW